MAKVYVFLADGFEDIEALAPIDILRRGGMDVVTVSVMDYQLVESAHGVSVMADALFDDVASFSDADLLVLPGGMPGASNLYNHEGLRRVLVDQYERQERIAAICASPGVVLAPLGILSGKRATCYPGFEQAFTDTTYTADLVTTDGLVTTACGPGAAMAFGYELLRLLGASAAADALQEGMRYNQLMERA
ncbi:MAG: DJ-1/PfpI family protein [Prevotella sp.]|nr:DJ-1/PfpI family protein [Prevotella sp.]